MDILATLGASFSWVFPVLVVLTILVFLHELGHYTAARLNGVRVEVFSIGFGRELFGWTDRHKTRWKVSLIPLGGYVRMFGDADASSAVDFEKMKTLTPAEQQETLAGKNVWQRIAVVGAGPLANILVTVLCFWIVFIYTGEPRLDATVGQMEVDAPAWAAGLRPQDKILKLDGEAIDDFQHLRRIISKKVGVPVAVTYARGSDQIDVTLTPIDRDGMGIIGIMPYREPKTVWSAFTGAIVGTGLVAVQMLQTFWNFIVGAEDSKRIGGLGSIAKLAKEAWSEGFFSLIGFMGLLSLNLGVLNLFPIPVLDGGHLLFYGIEVVRGRPVSEKIQDLAYKIGLYFLLAMMVYSHWNDLVRFKVFAWVASFFQ
ncbi:MAG: RIP metalloprotease RseP [Alphaproteobacteria bacterium]|nr:RIP metalloprotease RseP [Alphaproteobacteria bacterium]